MHNLRLPTWLRTLFIVLAASVALGICGELIIAASSILSGWHKDKITEYDVPRGDEERMLAAMMPRDNNTGWFFLMKGSARAVAAHKEEFDRFVLSVRFDGDQPTWTDPTGWKRAADPGARFAVLDLADTTSPLQATVSREVGPMIHDELLNINRWRGQLGLGPLDAFELESKVKRIEVDGQRTVLADITGPGGAKKPASSPAVRPSAPTPGEQVAYKAPAGWEKIAEPPGGSRVVTFVVKRDKDSAEVNIQWFSGALGTVAQNVNRWRGQVGLPQVSDAATSLNLRAHYLLAGKEAAYADITGEGRDAERILAVLSTRDSGTWTIKMIGPKDLVRDQQGAFDEFCESIRFGPQGGER